MSAEDKTRLVVDSSDSDQQDSSVPEGLDSEAMAGLRNQPDADVDVKSELADDITAANDKTRIVGQADARGVSQGTPWEDVQPDDIPATEEVTDKTRIVLPPQTGSGNQPKRPAQRPAGPASTRSANPKSVRAASVTPKSKAQPSDATKGSGLSQQSAEIKGRFLLKELLGAGGMGAVYKALDKRKVEAKDRDPFVAIKLLNDDFRRHPDSIIALQRESRKSQLLAHPNIVNVYDFDRDGDRVYMTMEYLEGDSMDKVMARRGGLRLDYEPAINIIRDISAALSYAHSHGIVHSDFKPGNIFVTKKGISKVFDFGIARAVSSSGVAGEGDANHKTVFDAGTLGALTPAYASLEMLKGEEPSTSDDVFALGCVAYEALTGQHPYDRKPATKAKELGLKPSKIPGISGRKWRAIEKALAYERKHRTRSVDEFIKGFFGKSKSPWWALAAGVVVVAVAGVSYIQVQQNKEKLRQAQQENEERLLEVKRQENQAAQQQLKEQEIKYLQERILTLVGQMSLTPAWEEDVKSALDEYKAFGSEEQSHALEFQQQVAAGFLRKAKNLREQGNLDAASKELQKAKSWEPEGNLLDDEASKISQAKDREQQALREARAAAEKEEELLNKKRFEEEQRLRRQRQQEEYRQALASVERSLSCSGLNQSTKAGVNSFAGQYPSQFADKKAGWVGALAGCVQAEAKYSPERASGIKQLALGIFPGEAKLRDLKIDYCGHLTAGSGKTCRDPIDSKYKPPSLVVVPGVASSGPTMAIGKYEISISQINTYCLESGQCSRVSGSGSLPAHNISVDVAQGYVDWLSQKTGFEYRLPSREEWQKAAQGRDGKEDPNRNCYIKFAGVVKGDKLVKVNSGVRNGYGLVNYTGNVQEWVLSNNQLLAVGGNFRDPMSRCLMSSLKSHSGSADDVTGFRVMRYVK